MSTQIIAETQQERKSEKKRKPDVQFVVDYFAQYQKALENEDKSPHTIRAYTIGATDFKDWFENTAGKGFDPAIITAFDVRAWRNDMLNKRRLAAATVNNYLAGLRSFLDWAIKSGLRPSYDKKTGLPEPNPVDNVKGVQQVKPAPRWMKREDKLTLLRTSERLVQMGDIRADGDPTSPGAIWPRRDNAIIYLLVSTGLRRSEAAALRLDDITIRPRSGNVHVRQGKGRKERDVPLNNDARKALRDWLKVRPQTDSPALFLSQKGGRLRARSLAGVVTKVAEEAGLDEVTAHTLRHTFAKTMVDNPKIKLHVVGHLCGHANLDTTRRYTTPSDEDLQSAVEGISVT